MTELNTIETLLREGIIKEVNKIVDEESEAAKERVAKRVADLKESAAHRVLSHMKLSRIDEFNAMKVQIVFETGI